MKEKRPYLALVFDLKKTPIYRRTKFDGKNFGESFAGYEKEYSNKRWAFYCTCGERTELDSENIKRVDSVIIADTPILCHGCHKIYKDLSNVKLIYSRCPIANVTSKRFGVVEKDNFYALYSFVTTVLVSVTTKKLIFKDSGNHSLYLSKKINAIRVKTGEKIITVPFRHLVKHCSGVLNHMALNALYDNIMDEGLFEKKVINPLIRFCEIVESRCDKRDVDRILSILNKERDDMYFNSFFKDLGKYPSTYASFYEQDCFYDLKSLNNCSENLCPHRYIWFQYLKRRLCIMLAIHMYAPLATIAISYGPDKFLNLLTDSSLMCSLTDLRKRKPTNPKDILETMFKRKVISEFYKKQKIEEYVKKENKKRKRKLKSKPDDRNLKIEVTSHPTLFVDTRIQITKDLKEKVNNIQFKKYYVPLFLEKFDSAAEVFYKFLNNNSAFDNIETIDKIICNNKIDVASSLIFNTQSCFSNIQHRLNANFKMNYQYVCHITKMVDNDNKIGKSTQLHSLMQLYGDTISMMIDMEIDVSDILKIKNSKNLHDLHDYLTQSYQIIKDKKLSENLKTHTLKYKNTESEVDGVKFVILDSPERFYEESDYMNHCVKTYFQSTAKGNYVIYSVEDLNTKERATLSIRISYTEDKVPYYSFDQLKAKNNKRASENIIGSTLKFIKKFFKINQWISHDLELQKKSEKTIEDEALDNIVINIIEPAEVRNNENDWLPF